MVPLDVGQPRRPRPGAPPRPGRAGRSRGRPERRTTRRGGGSSAPACSADDEPAAGDQRPGERGQGVGQLGRGQVDEGVPREHGGPARAVRRPHQPAQVAHLVVAVREAAPRLLDHARRQVDAGRVGAGVGEVRRHVTRAAAHLDHRAAVGVRGDPVEQPALERLCRAARRPGGRRTPWRPRRRTNAPARRGPRAPAASTDSRSTAGSGRGDHALRQRHVAQQVHPAGVVLAALAGQLADQRLGPGGQVGQDDLDRAAVGEAVQPVGAGPQLAGRLRTAQQQHGHERLLGVVQLQHLGEQLVVLQRPPALVGPHDAHQLPVLEPAQGRLDGRLVVVDDRVTAARLVAAGADGGERHRVGRRDGHLLLEEHPEDALLLGGELGEGHTAEPRRQHRPSRVDLRVDPFPRGLGNGRISAARPALRWGAVGFGVLPEGCGGTGQAAWLVRSIGRRALDDRLDG